MIKTYIKKNLQNPILEPVKVILPVKVIIKFIRVLSY